MTVKIKGRRVTAEGDIEFSFEGMESAFIGDVITITNTTDCDFTVTIDKFQHWYTAESNYDRGTTLLRNAAEAAEAYNEKKSISQRDWPSRRELRNV